MKLDDLNAIVELIESKASCNEATFGIYSNKDTEPDCHIKANANGLVMFALELLKAAGKFEDNLETGARPILFPQSDTWVDENSEIIIRQINQVQKRKVVEEGVRKSTFTEKLVPAGCFLILIFLFVALITGLVTIGRQMFE